MTVDQAAELTRNAVVLVLMLGAPIMLMAIIVGLAISILQAVTQLQDQTLSFVPKIIAMALAGLALLPWMMHRMVEYATAIFNNIPSQL
ncbi:MAG TPA: flagellar biosynthesis protein FliQ [Planctomycetaceae bacterium]|jgi:flagellar biosynthetic protein FliQ|nr:flagellar biosynthesis protein FliQ [Planctomycetaceae bacterium]